eukprot:4566279-Pleurochrysis_carterae.AAC.1
MMVKVKRGGWRSSFSALENLHPLGAADAASALFRAQELLRHVCKSCSARLPEALRESRRSREGTPDPRRAHSEHIDAIPTQDDSTLRLDACT